MAAVAVRGDFAGSFAFAYFSQFANNMAEVRSGQRPWTWTCIWDKQSIAFLRAAPITFRTFTTKGASSLSRTRTRKLITSCHERCQPPSDEKIQDEQKTPISRRHLLIKFLLPAAVALPFAYTTVANSSTGEASAETEQALRDLREVTGLQDLAFEYTNRFEFEKAEILWTKLISLNDQNGAAYSNRGNCRTSQGKFEQAVADFDRAIALSPEEPDPHLGKGVALEGLHEYRQALSAYELANSLSVKKYSAADAVAINNMGNAHGSLGEWEEAYANYKQAAQLDSRFVFALANEALARYQLGDDDEAALKTMGFLTRKYPQFGDMHAAIAMALWDVGKRSEAEDEWFKAVSSDKRYEDTSWVRSIRRWPPRLIRILENFRAIR